MSKQRPTPVNEAGITRSRNKAKKAAADERRRILTIEARAIQVPIKATTKVGRNDPCECGSGRKYKRCCLRPQRPGLAAETGPGPWLTIETGEDR